MFSHYVLTLYRNLARHRLYAAINVLGLAVGVSVCLMLQIVVSHEQSYDAWLKGSHDVYLLAIDYQRPGYEQRTFVTPGVVLPLLRQDYPQIAAATRIMGAAGRLIQPVAADKIAGLSLVDPDFGRVFPLPMRTGSLSALNDPSSAAISEAAATKLFGTPDAMGRELHLEVEGQPYSFRIAAVYRNWPEASMMQVNDILVQMRPELTTGVKDALTRWGESSMMTAFRIPDRRQAAAMSADLQNFVARRGPQDELGAHPERGVIPVLEPLRDAHFDMRTRGLQSPTVDRAVVSGMGLLGAATLLLAIVNAVNLATARQGLRAREVAVRKALGASRLDLLAQFMAEALVASVLAVALALALVELALPGVNALLGAHLKLRYFGADGMAPLLVGLTLGVAFLSGVYPALVLSALPPASTLASARAPGGGRSAGRVRAGLVGLQFAISTALIACTGVALAQASFEQRGDTGFQRANLLEIDGADRSESAARRAPLLDALRATPGVTAVAVTDRGVHNQNASSSNFSRPGLSGPDRVAVIETVGGDYLHAYAARLLAGRWFDPAQGLDDRRGPKFTDSGVNVVLNRTASRLLGFATPQAAVDQTIFYGGSAPLRVVGVVEDIRFLGPRNHVDPTVYAYDSVFAQGEAPTDWRVAVRYAGTPEPQMRDRVQAVTRTFTPGGLTVRPVSVELADYYRPDERRSRLFAAGAALAVALGCVGLYGLAAFTAARRIKEIGIRKTLGASTADILRLLIGQFLAPVALANLVAWPLAWLAMRSWLSGFDQRIDLGPQYFLAATALTLLIALLTVAGQALRVARAEPARALRYE